MDILILAHSRWEGKYSSTILSLAKVLAKENRVLYIGKPYTIKDILFGLGNKEIRRRLPALLFGINYTYQPVNDNHNFIVITPLMIWSINWLPAGKLFAHLSKINDMLIYRTIKKSLRDFHIRNFTYINSFQPLFGNYFPESFRPSKFIYHCVDEIRSSPYVSKHGTRLEKGMVERADEVVTTSKELSRLKSAQSKNVSIVPNAADVKLFQRAVNEILLIPSELRGLPSNSKVITYVGNICHRLDYSLISAISKRLRDHFLLMIGPISHQGFKEFDLDKRNNIIFTGPKKLEELPAYLRYSHCGIIPFLCNQVTKSIYPLKVNEYLSAGLPVVSTRFSDDILDFSNIIYVSTSQNEFIKSIQRAIVTNNPNKKQNRIDFAANNSWEDRAEKFLEIIKREKKWNTPIIGNRYKQEKRKLTHEL